MYSLLADANSMLTSARFTAAASLLASIAYGASAYAAPVPPPAFGDPPSGDVSIFFNDHTVYAKPDILKKGRVLAAFIKNGQIYVPLRSMFEQMGAMVKASDDGRTFTATKSGANVTVTLGKPEVTYNGEVRPLDVPPVLYRGVVLVPIRVISEALGAYVQWVPSKRVVVVRYLSAVPEAPAVTPPVPLATAAATPKPTIPPTAVVTAPPLKYYGGFVQAAYLAPRNYNEFSAGKYCPEAYVLAASYAFKNSPLAVKADFREYGYVTSDNLTDSISNHYTRFATIDGGTALTPVFLARQSSLDARLEYEIAPQRINAGIGYLHTTTNYGYPNLNAVGFGLEKLPVLTPGLRFSGSVFYYPGARGSYTVTDARSPNAGSSYDLKYDVVKFDIGLALVLAHSPLYIHGGFDGDHYIARSNAPIGQTHDGPYIGLGVKL